jgi:hypothetical protein
MLVGASILIALGENRRALRDEEASHMIRGEIVVERPALSQIGIANVRLAGGTAQRSRRLRGLDRARREQVVEMTERADAAAQFPHIGDATTARISLTTPIGVGLRPIRPEARPCRSEPRDLRLRGGRNRQERTDRNRECRCASWGISSHHGPLADDSGAQVPI